MGSRGSGDPSRFRAWLTPRLDGLIILSAFGLLSPWLSSGLDPLNLPKAAWMIDLLAHWQWPIAIVFGVSVLLHALVGARSRLLLAPALLLPWFSASPRLAEADAPAPTITIATINLHVSATETAGLRQFLDTTQPDLVVLMELNESLAAQLPAFTDYPEQHLAPEDSPFGIGVLSRLALQDIATLTDPDGLAEIDMKLRVGERAVAATVLHPMPPMASIWHRARRAKLAAAVDRLSSFDGPTLIIGDLNASPWSSALRRLPGDYRRATTLEPTWPTWGFGVFGIPIDMVLASPEWRVKEARVDPAFGSDHAPVVVTLTLPSLDGEATR